MPVPGFELYDPTIAPYVREDLCLLCGNKLTPQNATREHVFPRWLQRMFNLENETLTLLNGTKIRYRQLLVPCCLACNTGPLSSLEQQVSQAVQRGYDAFTRLPEPVIFRWVAKLYYGVLRREVSLRSDRARADSPPIVQPGFMERFRALHTFLQSIRFPMRFEGFVPWSIFAVRVHPGTEFGPFDYRDNLNLIAAMRMGEIGLIVCLQDNGTLKKVYGEYVSSLQTMLLHPIQFLELVAKISYKAYLMNRIPKYITIYPPSRNGEFIVVSPPLQGFVDAPIFDEGDPKEYAHFLSRLLGLPFEAVYREPGLVASFIHNEDGSLNRVF